MKSEIGRMDLEAVAARAVDAANQISCGRALEEVDVAGFALYLARADQDDDCVRALVGVMDYDEYLRILDNVAKESGLCLDKMTELEVSLPEMEFGDDLVTGGFENFKGISVEQRNNCLIELTEAVSTLLEKRGLAVTCTPDEDVIFYLPLR